MKNNVFFVFFWKNFLFLKFNWLSWSVINLACISIIYIFLRSTHSLITAPSHIYESKSTENLRTKIPVNDGDFIFYGPSNDFLDHLMENVRIDLFMPIGIIKPFKNTSAMLISLESHQKTNCFAILFEDWPNSTHTSFLNYSISSTHANVSPNKRFVNDDDINGIIDEDEYIRTGFLTLQHIIDLNYIKTVTNTDIKFNIEISPLPNAEFEYVDGQRIDTYGTLFAFLFSVLLLTTTLVPLVEEKNDGIKEFLVLATPLNFLNGLTFFIIRFVSYLPFILGSAVIANVFQAIGLIPLSYIIILLLLYCSASLCYTFLISVCFNSVFYAKVGGFFLLMTPYLFDMIDGKLSKFATFTFSTTTFLKGVHIFQVISNKHRQFSSSDLFFNLNSTTPNMFSIFLSLISQCLLYAILYNYFSIVFPGKGGLKQPFLFFCKSFLNRKKHRNLFTTASLESDDTAIIIENLVKSFHSKKRVIKVADRLNMDIKNRRITVLLGHNGAGKTTILNIIIGCVSKDSGKIIVCTERDVSFYRHLIGFCPQHSVFMQYMSCFQHLTFFAQLRGRSKDEAESLASELLRQLRLVEKANEYGKNLSGGMKRRLSLGIALSGETKVVILDEPSSGLDVESRRELWDILLELRKSKAVLITTHHMEEAEILGDTISILADGKICQTGSSLELKRKYGGGYVLKLRTHDQFSEYETMEIIQESIPTARLLNTVPPTVLISMPYLYKHKYSEVLKKLENNRDQLGIASIAVTDTSLEEVFLNSQSVDNVDSPSLNETALNIPYQKLYPNSVSWTRQLYAVFYKKLIFIQSRLIYSFITFSIPFVAIGLAIFTTNILLKKPGDETLKFDLNHLQNGFIYLSCASEDFILKENLKTEIEKSGIQVKCLSEKNPAEEELIILQSQNLYDFYEHAIGAIIFQHIETEPTLKVLYSANILHSSVIMVNLIDNAILKMASDTKNTINIAYAPIRRIIDVNPSSLENFATIVTSGFFFYMLFYAYLPYLENKSNFKNLQSIPSHIYWTSFVAFDMLLHTAICVTCFAYQHAIMPQSLYSNDDQIVISLTYLFYGFSYLPILYCMAIGFRSISPITTYLFFMFIVSSIVPFITSDNLQTMKYFATTITFMSFMPDFSFNHQLRIINEMFFEKLRKSNREVGSPSLLTFFGYAVFLFVFVMLFLIIVWDNIHRRLRLKEILLCSRRKRTGYLDKSLENLEENLVQKEKQIVQDIFKSKTEDSYPLLLANLHKFYGNIHAVRGINFAIKRKECFGLLGVNGAGKTSTFQMITANSPLSCGQIMIEGVSLTSHETLYKYRFGYCPQGDCLNTFMTSYQILKYMALLRNVDYKDLHLEVRYWLDQLNLSKYQNIPIRFYSGGTKRKVNAAIAMIGNPSLVLLDEPTTGVDPISRRFLWKCIQNFQKRDKTVILTSHSMDECEHLCNRLAIMARGQLQCIGYIPDLKKKYGSGFTIKVKLARCSSSNEVNIITSTLKENFNCELREQHAGMLTYFITEKQMEWSDVFRRTEDFLNSSKNLVEDYSVNETSLEDIFLKFDNGCRRDS